MTIAKVRVFEPGYGPSPTSPSAWFTRPFELSSMLQPNARTTTETSSGARITSRKMERYGSRMRERM